MFRSAVATEYTDFEHPGRPQESCTIGIPFSGGSDVH
jgi:hypothetical protein